MQAFEGGSLSIYVKYYGGQEFFCNRKGRALKNMQIKIKMHQPSPCN
jgi:hypothetical protein